MLGVHALIFSLMSMAPIRENAVSAVISAFCQSDLNFAVMWTVASRIVFSSRPAKSVSFSPSCR